MSKESNKKNLWGGRFTGETDAGFAEFNRSFSFDRRLFAVDVRASIAHCNGLLGAGVLSSAEAEMIRNALNGMLEHGAADPSYFDKWPHEDIHRFFEAHLVEMHDDLVLWLCGAPVSLRSAIGTSVSSFPPLVR